MKLTVLLFAAAKEAVGRDQVELELPDSADVKQLRGQLSADWPQLAAAAPTLHVAVNGEFAGDAVVLQPDDEVACFPPVSGG